MSHINPQDTRHGTLRHVKNSGQEQAMFTHSIVMTYETRERTETEALQKRSQGTDHRLRCHDSGLRFGSGENRQNDARTFTQAIQQLVGTQLASSLLVRALR